MPRLRLLPFLYPEDLDGWTVSARRHLIALLLDVATDEIRGPRLQSRPGMYDLSDCRKLYVFREAPDGGYRAIYKIIDNTLELVAVGPRQGNVAYTLAGERLGRAKSRETISFDGRKAA